jgi:hypothetical protein
MSNAGTPLIRPWRLALGYPCLETAREDISSVRVDAQVTHVVAACHAVAHVVSQWCERLKN